MRASEESTHVTDMPEVRQAGSSDQPDVARADDRDVHDLHPDRTAFSGPNRKSRINARRRGSVL